MSEIAINWIDISIVLIFLVSIAFGIKRGFFLSVVSLFVWIAAMVVAVHYGPTFADHLTNLSTDNQTRLFVAYGLLFVAAFIVGFVIRLLLKLLIDRTGLSMTDRLMGGLFGIIRAIFIIALLVFLLSLTTIAQSPSWKEAKLLPYFVKTADWFKSFAPQAKETADTQINQSKSNPKASS
jgi:membrane protein required for colicin V production